MFGQACAQAIGSRPVLDALRRLLEPSGRFEAGRFLFRVGDPFRMLWVVRRGMVKTSRIAFDGREQVLAFHLPGEVLGLDAVYPGYHPSDAIALEPTECCRFPLAATGALAARYPDIQQQLFRLFSKELDSTQRLAGNFSAEERVAAFLLDLGARYARCGHSGISIHLSMTRQDIANYLRLAGETVSRVLARLRTSGLIAVDGPDIELRDLPLLQHLAGCALWSWQGRSVPVRVPHH